MSPTVHANRLQQRIANARQAFKRGETTDGRPYPTSQQRKDETGLAVSATVRADYLRAANWGVTAGHIEPGEFALIQSALSGALDPETGWHVITDLAVKVVVTKVCNELLQLRGDA